MTARQRTNATVLSYLDAVFRPRPNSCAWSSVYLGVGEGEAGGGARAPLKFGKKIFFGQFLCKIRAFFRQKSCQIREFCKLFGQIS